VNVAVNRNLHRFAVFGLAGGFCAWSAGFIYRSSFIGIDGARYFSLFDDAMISMRYAWNFSHGDGLVWNVGERVQGYTNLLMTLVMSVATLVFGRSASVLAIQVLGVGFMIAIAVIAMRVSDRVLPGLPDGRRELTRSLAFFCALAYYPLPFWSLMGMETGLLAFLVLGGVLGAFCYADTLNAKFILATAGSLGMASLTRLDSILFAALVFGFIAWGAKTDRRNRRRILAHLAGSLVLFGLLALSQFIFQYSYYGEALPNTYTLKLTGMALGERLRNGAGYLIPFFKESIVIWILAGVGLACAWNARAALLASLAVSALLYQLYVGGDAWNYWRIIAPTMPLIFLLAIVGTDQLWAMTVSRRGVLVAGTVGVAVLSASIRFLPEIILIRRAYMVANNEENVNAAVALNRLTTDDATLAVLFAGSLPYYIDRKAIDLLGKSDPYIARLAPDLSGSISWSGMKSVPGHNKYDLDYSIKKLEPTYAQILEWGTDNLTEWASTRYVTVDYRGVRLYLRRGSPTVIWANTKAH
jgi:hypothetical protein